MNTKMLKSKRILKYKTQEEMANRLNMSSKSYNQKAKGKQQFKAGEILKISMELNLSKEEVNEIFFDGKLDGSI